MTPDYWTLTISQHVHGHFPAAVFEDVYGPTNRDRIIEVATRLDQQLYELDGVLLTDRERTCTRGWING